MLVSIPAAFCPILLMMKSLTPNPAVHTVLCGWNSQTTRLLDNLLAVPPKTQSGIVLVNQLDKAGIGALSDRFAGRDLATVTGDFTDEDVLRAAGIGTAALAIIVPDYSMTIGSDSRGPDERTILAALAIKSISPNIPVSALVKNGENAIHLRHARVNTVILQGEFSELALSRTGLAPLLPDVLRTMLGPSGPAVLRQEPIPAQFSGTTFQELSRFFEMRNAGIVVGVVSKDRERGLAVLLDDTDSETDNFIKRKFQEAELELNGGDSQKATIRLNPGADFPIGPHDTAFVIG